MTLASGIRDALQSFFGSARLAESLVTLAVGLGVFAFALQQVVGWFTLASMLVTLCLLCAGSLIARRESIEWFGFTPISLLAFVGWAVVSIFWSQYQWASFGGIVYLAAFTFLGIYAALVRDTIQIIRVFGNVLRVTLALSLALEIFAGLLIDSPIPLVQISGNLDQGGPISGIVGNRNELGVLAVIGMISFVIEWRTRSVTRGTAMVSLIIAAFALLFTQSPVGWGIAVVAFAVSAALYGVRRIPQDRRQFWQLLALGLAMIGAITAWLFRVRIIELLAAGGELSYRMKLWQEVWALLPLHSAEGWGWIGQWHQELSPFLAFGADSARPSTSAVNAYLDVWFQLGAVGLLLFLAMVGLAFTRSWLLAARRRSVVFTWPAIVLASLLTASLAESSILYEFGWITFVICCVKASQSLSWRTAFQRPLEQDPL